MHVDERRALEELDFRLNVILPEQYQGSYNDLPSVSMGSAGLKYGTDGKVAWDEMWATFCDLAMAGGPPHKGTLLEHGRRADVMSQPGRYDEVVEEICRGIVLASELPATASPVQGWVRVDCFSETMAAWLLRAIVMENVEVRRYGRALDLPAAPGFRLEKEIKNVITVTAKTCHYWMGHVPRAQKQAIADLFVTLEERTPLVEPDWSGDGTRTAGAASVASRMADTIGREIGLASSGHAYAGWLGVECTSAGAAIWMMRALVASNVLARREATVLFVPVNPATDPDGLSVVRILYGLHRLAAVAGVS